MLQGRVQNEIHNPFWEVKVLLLETQPAIIRLVEKVMEKSRVFHFLRRIDNLHDLNFELRYNTPDIIVTGRTMRNFDAGMVLDQIATGSTKIPVIVIAPDFNASLNIQLVNSGAYDIIYHTEIGRLPKEIAFIQQSGYRGAVRNF